MYSVEAEIPKVDFSLTYPVEDLLSAEWDVVHDVLQDVSDYAEYQEARTVAEYFRKYYKNVRIVKSNGGFGLREIIRECPFTQSHTREWCGYSECRES